VGFPYLPLNLRFWSEFPTLMNECIDPLRVHQARRGWPLHPQWVEADGVATLVNVS
jgi:hypothetical protein